MNSYLYKIKKKINGYGENSRTVIKNALSTLVIKGGALIISLLTMPAYIAYFDDQYVLGLWFTILAVLNWVLTFDFGIGNGLRNHLVHALVKKDNAVAKRYISSAYIIIGTIVFITLLFSMIIFNHINWNLVFNISTELVSEDTLYYTVTIVFVGIMLQFFLKIITSVLYALQKSALINLLSLLSSLTIFIFVSSINFKELSINLIVIAIVHLVAVNLPLLLASIVVFSSRLKSSRPSWYFFEWNYAKNVVLLGGSFFWIQLMYMIITATNEWLISWFSSPDMVVEYQIYNKLFTTLGILFTLALTPIWSAVTKALSEKDYSWIEKLYKTLRLLALLAVVCQFIMIPFLQTIIDFWLKNNSIQVNYGYSLVFAIFGSVFIWSGILSIIVNGLGELKIQSIVFTVGALIKIPLSWWLVISLDSWIGIVVANIIAMSLYCVIQPIWLNNFFKNKKFGDEEYV